MYTATPMQFAWLQTYTVLQVQKPWPMWQGQKPWPMPLSCPSTVRHITAERLSATLTWDYENNNKHHTFPVRKLSVHLDDLLDKFCPFLHMGL